MRMVAVANAEKPPVRCGTCLHFKRWEQQPDHRHTQQLRRLRDVGDCLYSLFPDSAHVEDLSPMEASAGKDCPCWHVNTEAVAKTGGKDRAR